MVTMISKDTNIELFIVFVTVVFFVNFVVSSQNV
jgi:hypothetical protein